MIASTREETTVSATTVRIRQSTREQLRELEGLTGVGPTEVLARAVDSFRRSLLLADTDLAYAALRRDSSALADVDDEQTGWDQTLGDGLEQV